MNSENNYYHYALSQSRYQTILLPNIYPKTRNKLIEEIQKQGLIKPGSIDTNCSIIDATLIMLNNWSNSHIRHVSEDVFELQQKCRRSLRAVERGYENNSSVPSNASLFYAMADVLWILASTHYYSEVGRSEKIELIDDPSLARKKTIDFLNSVKDDFTQDEEEYSAIEEADGLPISRLIFSGLISDRKVSYYAGLKASQYQEFERLLSQYKTGIIHKKTMFYCLLTTAIRFEELYRGV